jgi:tRNA (guanine-N7-)-methyltransferase
MNLSSSTHRPIRSFVRREGRITPAQARALAELWPRYGIAAGDTPLDFSALFGRRAPMHVEIGFGNGVALADMAGQHPENNYLGIEVHRPGVGTLLRRLATDGLSNVRIISADATEVLARQIPDDSFSAIYLFFPDPWPKQRHHKRRLVQSDFTALAQRKLKIGGTLHLATDWTDYAEQMLAVLTNTEGLENAAGAGNYAPRPPERRLTRFEQRGQRLGHEVRDLVFQRHA